MIAATNIPNNSDLSQASIPVEVLECKGVYVADLVLSVSNAFSDQLISGIPYFRNLSKSYDELYLLIHPIVSAFLLYKCTEYVRRSLLKTETEFDYLWNSSLKRYKNEALQDPLLIINEYKDASIHNDYMKEMFLGDKICKICGGTFSNRYLIDEITVRYLFFFNKFIIPSLGRIWMTAGSA